MALMRLIVGKWLNLFCVAVVALCMCSTPAQADDSGVPGILVSTLMPGDADATAEKDPGFVERFLRDSLKSVQSHTDTRGETGAKTSWMATKEDAAHGRAPADAIMPGAISSRRFGPDHPLLPAPGAPVVKPASAQEGLLDVEELISSKANPATDPAKDFTSFEVLVDTKKYTIELYGAGPSGRRTRLYDARVGLGSTDYPTPKGAYFLTLIYDDHPLWIPPPRDWAWGQAPSRSVYGGHMMPFFRKIPARGKAADNTIEELDNIAPEQKMVDGGMYRIHGTDSPWSVGSAQSHGCVRMRNKDVARLADILKSHVGTGERGQSANGSYVNLARPVRLILF